MVAALLLAGLSGVADHRTRKRRDADRVGVMPWPLVQILALFAALVLTGFALNLR